MANKQIADYCLMLCAFCFGGMFIILNYFTTNEIVSSVYVFGTIFVLCWYLFMSNFFGAMQQIIDHLEYGKGD